MVPLSPIATLALLSGSAGQVDIFATTPGYDPSSVNDYVAPTPSTWDVVGVFSKADIAGIEVAHDALFMIDVTTAPAGLLPEKSMCRVNGETYVVKAVQDRWYMAARDGLTLQLAQASGG